MKNVLCFGDSNTFGFTMFGGRHPMGVRWTSRLQEALGADYRIIEEGLGGRTTVFEDPIDPGRNGRTALPMCIASHNPIDLIIIMLGTNDMKHHFSATSWDIAQGMNQLIHIVRSYPYGPNYTCPKILVVSPVLLREGIEQHFFKCFTPDAVAISRELAPAIREICEANGCAFFDAATVAEACPEDCLHLNAENHAKLAAALEPVIRALV